MPERIARTVLQGRRLARGLGKLQQRIEDGRLKNRDKILAEWSKRYESKAAPKYIS